MMAMQMIERPVIAVYGAASVSAVPDLVHALVKVTRLDPNPPQAFRCRLPEGDEFCVLPPDQATSHPVS
jgi:hypothetical protein